MLVPGPLGALLVAGDLGDVASVFSHDALAQHRVVAVERLGLLLSLRRRRNVVVVVEEVIHAG